jgi:hypothetical protein
MSSSLSPRNHSSSNSRSSAEAAFVDDPITLVGSDLGLVQGRPAAGQVGPGRLQSLLGRLGAGLGLL